MENVAIPTQACSRDRLFSGEGEYDIYRAEGLTILSNEKLARRFLLSWVDHCTRLPFRRCSISNLPMLRKG